MENRSDEEMFDDGDSSNQMSSQSKLDPEVYSRICYICKEVAERHHVHYGALACFSCRAFFRRAHQKAKEPQFVCKKGGNCDVNPKNRRKCQACRYKLCLEAGMNPAWVLDEEQKKVRFRNMILKRINEEDEPVPLEPGQRPKRRPMTIRSAMPPGTPRPSTSRRSPPESPFSSPGSIKSPNAEMRDLQRSPFNGRSPYGGSQRSFASQRSAFESTERPTDFRRGSYDALREPHRNPSTPHSYSTGSMYNFSFPSPDCKMEPHTPRPLKRTHSGDTAGYLSAPPPVSEPPIYGGKLKNYFRNRSASFSEMAGHSNNGTNSPKEQDEPQYQEPRSMDNDQLLQEAPKPDEKYEARVSRLDNEEIESPSAQRLCNDSSESPMSSLSSQLSPTMEMVDELYCSSQHLTVNLLTSSLAKQKVIRNIVKKYAKAFQSVKLDKGFIDKMSAFHRGEITLQVKDLYLYLNFLRSVFRTFAHKNDIFSSLPETDQRALLDRNSSLFVQYFISTYFNISDGFYQLRWILGPNLPPSDIDQGSIVQISFPFFNEVVGLFKNENIRDVCLDFTQKLSSNPANLIHPALMMNMILFSSNSETNLEDRGLITEHFDRLVSMCDEIQHEDLDSLLESLEGMALIYSLNVHLGIPEPIGSNTIVPLPFPYTTEEERWIGNQFNLFNQAYREIPMGEDQIWESVMFSFDVPLSRNYMRNFFSMAVERYRQVIKIHPEVSALQDEDQKRLCSWNCWRAVALNIARLESTTTMKEQMQFSFGELDEEVWEKRYAGVVDWNSLKRIQMSDFNNTNQALDPAVLKTFVGLVKNLSKLVDDNDMFRLVSFITLFTIDGHQMSPQGTATLVKLRGKYITLLKRRLEKKYSGGSEKQIYGSVLSATNDISELAKILMNFPM